MEDESKENVPMDYGNTDAVMMLLMYSAAQLIDRNGSIHRQSQAIAEFQAKFMNMRSVHEREHVALDSGGCPFCAARSLQLNLNRQ